MDTPQPISAQPTAPNVPPPQPTTPFPSPQSEPSDVTLPGPVALVKSGLSIYRSQLKPVLIITVLSTAITAGGFELARRWFLSVFHSVPDKSAVLHILSHLGFAKLLGIFGLGFLVYLVVGLWFTLTLMYILRGHNERVGVGAALSASLKRFFSFLWIRILVFLSIFGCFFIAMVLCGLLLGVSALFSLHFVPRFAYYIASIAFLSVSVVAVSVWFLQTDWIFVDGDAAGVKALALSRWFMGRFARTIVWPIVGVALLVFCLSLGVKVIFGIAGLFLGLFFAMGPGTLVPILLGNLELIVTGSVIAPIALATLLALFEAMKSKVVFSPVKPPRTWDIIVISSAGFVFLALVLVPVVLIAAYGIPAAQNLPSLPSTLPSA